MIPRYLIPTSQRGKKLLLPSENLLDDERVVDAFNNLGCNKLSYLSKVDQKYPNNTFRGKVLSPRWLS